MPGFEAEGCEHAGVSVSSGVGGKRCDSWDAGSLFAYGVLDTGYKYDLSLEEVAPRVEC